MPTRDTLGGIVHTYQRYDPARIPPPRPRGCGGRGDCCFVGWSRLWHHCGR